MNTHFGRYGDGLSPEAWAAIGSTATAAITSIGGAITSGQQASAAQAALKSQQAKAKAAAARIKAEEAKLALLQSQINQAPALPASSGGSDNTPILLLGLAVVAAVAIVAWPKTPAKRGKG